MYYCYTSSLETDSLRLIKIWPLIHVFPTFIQLICSVSITNTSVILEARKAFSEDSECTTRNKKNCSTLCIMDNYWTVTFPWRPRTMSIKIRVITKRTDDVLKNNEPSTRLLKSIPSRIFIFLFPCLTFTDVPVHDSSKLMFEVVPMIIFTMD